MSTTKRYDKLVRDKIPEVLTLGRIKHVWHQASIQEFDTKLKQKLKEKVAEFLEKPTLEELADILEVVMELSRTLKGGSPETLELLRKSKKEERGGFHHKIILETTEEEK